MLPVLGEKKNEVRMSLTPDAASSSIEQRRLRHERHDHPGDQIQLGSQRERHHRLHVQDEARLLIGTDVLFPIELEGHADEIRDGIRQLLGQFRAVAGTGRVGGKMSAHERRLKYTERARWPRARRPSGTV